MTDRELMQMALDTLELITSKPEKISYYCSFAVEIENLRARLAQPEREWQGLTDEEILEEYRQSYGDDGSLTDVYFAHAIEARLKEKNSD